MSPAVPEAGRRLVGRRILITGGASGVGAATAALFRREGAKVVIADRDRQGLQRVAKDTGAIAIPFDVSDEKSVRAGVDRAAEVLGGLDGVANCAGLSISVSFEETDLETWNQAITVNLTGVYLVCHAALPYLKRAYAATIVNVSSAVGHQPLLNRAAYAASKSGVLGFTKVLSMELAPRIRCNALSPGAVETPMVTNLFTNEDQLERIRSLYGLKRMGRAEELAEAILYLTGPESSFVTGSTLVVDGGRIYY